MTDARLELSEGVLHGPERQLEDEGDRGCNGWWGGIWAVLKNNFY